MIYHTYDSWKCADDAWPGDEYDYEEREELCVLGRVMDDEPQGNPVEPEPSVKIERIWPPVIDDQVPFEKLMSNQKEKPNQFEIAVEAYVSEIKLRDKVDYELRQAFLAGVQYGIKTAQDAYKS